MVQAVHMFVKAPNEVPLADTSTVLVTPSKGRSSTFPTQNVSV